MKSLFHNCIWHLHTIRTHRRRVRKFCFKLWLYWQWLVHDLSKYSPTEFFVWVKYFQWYRSPNVSERKDKWYSSARLHHKWRNKHHYEYRNDLVGGRYQPIKMPIRYVKEMFCDMLAAWKTYKWAEFKSYYPFEYFQHNADKFMIHPDTVKLLESRLIILKDKWEDEVFTYINTNYKDNDSRDYITYIV